LIIKGERGGKEREKMGKRGGKEREKKGKREGREGEIVCGI